MATLRNILVADDEASIRHVLSLVLKGAGFEVRAVADGHEALAELSAHPYDAVVTDVRMPRVDGLSLLTQGLQLNPELTFIMMSAYGAPDAAMEAVAKGAYGYLQKPFKPEEMVLLLRKADERRRLVSENRRLRQGPLGNGPLEQLIGQSVALEAVKRQILKLAPVSTTVMITGESGTGKELVARAIHQLSPRAAMPFVAINCGAIPPGLIESELFGHVKGAFTDARSARRGLIAEADGGTLLLDEVAELPAAAQVKLLRFLQEGELRPVGETRAEKVDVRVLAATLRDVTRLVERGEFREDLYYRLNVVNLKVPALRERSDDILQMARAFILRFNRELNREAPVETLSPEAESLLTTYPWPGNVRELENAMERAVLLAEGSVVEVKDLPEKLWAPRGPLQGPLRETPGDAQSTEANKLSLKRAIPRLEENYIRQALRRTRGNRTRAAELLEISHRALLYKIKEYGIDPDREGGT